MKIKAKLTALFVAASAAFALSANAATVSVSGTTPVVSGSDISMLDMTGASGVGKFWTNEAFGAGQTFTTGSDAGYELNTVTIRFIGGGTATKDYLVRVGTLTPGSWDGNNQKSFTLLASETGQQTIDALADDWLTYTFDTPVSLNPNTEYAFDIHMTASAQGWQSGIPNVYRGGDNYTGGESYTLNTNTDGNNSSWSATDLATVNKSSGDFVFALDVSVVPEPSSSALFGLGALAMILRRRR